MKTFRQQQEFKQKATLAKHVLKRKLSKGKNNLLRFMDPSYLQIFTKIIP